MPVVLRISVGAKYGAQHSQDWTALVYHIPGLKVVYPVTPYDAKGMLNSALAGSDPVVFFESQKVYDYPEMFVDSGVPEGYYEIPSLNPPSNGPARTSPSSPSAPPSTPPSPPPTCCWIATASPPRSSTSAPPARSITRPSSNP